MAYRLTVLGTSYLGTTHAACMADLGYEVLGVDVDAEKIAHLADGDVPELVRAINVLVLENQQLQEARDQAGSTVVPLLPKRPTGSTP